MRYQVVWYALGWDRRHGRLDNDAGMPEWEFAAPAAADPIRHRWCQIGRELARRQTGLKHYGPQRGLLPVSQSRPLLLKTPMACIAEPFINNCVLFPPTSLP